MKYGIKIMGWANGKPCEFEGEWLESMDFEAHAPGRPYPTGSGASTEDPAKALAFDTAAEATEFWRRPSKTVPIRLHDGQSNRPLTVFTISVEELPDAEAKEVQRGLAESSE